MTKCSQDLLDAFSLEHFTFINQIFGDATVRQIIAELFENPRYEFGVEVVDNSAFDHGFHHILISKPIRSSAKRAKTIPGTLYCSVEECGKTKEIDSLDSVLGTRI